MTASGHRRVLTLAGAVVLVAVTLGAVGVADAQLNRGDPSLDVYLPDNEVDPGTEAELAVQIQNDADVSAGTGTEGVTTARAVEVEVTDDGPFEIPTEKTPIGSIADGTTGTANLNVRVPETIDPGTYEIDLRVRYSATRQESSVGDQRVRRSTRETVEVRIADGVRFDIDEVWTDVQPGTTGDATVVLENTGSETAYGARATVTGSGGVTIDDGAAEAFLGDLEAGDSEMVTVDAAVAEAVGGGPKPVEATLNYRDENGVERGSRTVDGSLDSLSAQSFSIEALEDTLAVGYDGRITGTVRNDGPKTLTDGVLVAEPASDSLFIEEQRVALSELAPGETESFVYPTDVSGQAEAGPRQVRFTLEYADGGRTTASVGPVSERVVVDDQRDAFTITSEDIRIQQGSTEVISLTLTNERPETLSNLNARLYTDSPLSSGSDEGFINELAPGESDDVRFEVSASSRGMPNTYRVEIDIQYDTERGDTVLSRTYQHPVEVEERTDDGDDGPSLLLIALVVAALVGAGIWWRRRD
ncbi:uncharacterized protein NP_3128A [Natronomonas pharaonis DSM 2160]|uniref:Uncharacterized protein n=1 Tax=Natronomonas pharaonis (strain ATCC 35678 / DSM 2160 / CIP 103997 / JCM 8858 / NBRC 14720 / NCIMB 2260 / Gabara) TaxID=348780 RepID=A0A1U7EX34_NATPD|nr:COG1361 S-layer family protein [Natronomonas pharaonis]CAI49655.1 uncharacterized protein NP_3128A [Natronomonas pharaonis DSM 2160]